MTEDNILTPSGWMRGRLVHEHGKVVAIDGTPCDPADNDHDNPDDNGNSPAPPALPPPVAA